MAVCSEEMDEARVEKLTSSSSTTLNANGVEGDGETEGDAAADD